MAVKVRPTKTARATILITTRPMLKVALSRAPRASRAVTATVISTAGRLMIPPACGPARISGGRLIPTLLSRPTM
jgi:hypothetical protein